MNHKQTIAKVNVLVDEKVVPLIEALSGYDGVFTYESCENSVLGTYVCLHYGSPTEPSLMDTVQFADFLAKILDGTNCTVSVEWLTMPSIVLRLHPETISDVSARLVCHKTACLHDRIPKRAISLDKVHML